LLLIIGHEDVQVYFWTHKAFKSSKSRKSRNGLFPLEISL